MLSDEDKREITRRMQKANHRIWTNDVLTHVFDIISRIRDGTIQRKEYFIPGILTYEDYIFQLNLIKFV